MAAGNPPTAMQMLGLVIQDWAEQGVLGDLTPLAEKDGWDKVIPPALQKIVKYDGHYVAAPFNMHSTNWVWVNKALFDKVGGTEPTTWEDFVRRWRRSSRMRASSRWRMAARPGRTRPSSTAP